MPDHAGVPGHDLGSTQGVAPSQSILEAALAVAARHANGGLCAIYPMASPGYIAVHCGKVVACEHAEEFSQGLRLAIEDQSTKWLMVDVQQQRAWFTTPAAALASLYPAT